MSISSEINRISQNVSDSLTAVASKGATVPSGANSDDLPDLIASLPSTNTVTYNLTGGVSASVNPSKAITGQGLSLKLTAPTGYVLLGVTVTMGGTDITSQVFTPDEAGGGGSSEQSETGTFTGNNGITVQIPCSFEPDLIRVYGDLSGDVSLRGIASLTIIKNDSMSVFSDTTTSSDAVYQSYAVTSGMVGYNDVSSPHASYANGVLTIDMITNTSSNRFTSGIEYTYKFIKWTT